MYQYAKKFRELREEKGLSQLELAKRLGTSHQNINRWESGKATPNIEFCARLADFYDISLDSLIGRDYPKKNW
ncbi:MAG: helix-turn-helix transcriptional regulator [Clostridia bacterium]|nr:helix-turn-helix transcriptional regulator [Clostridia bacterium]